MRRMRWDWSGADDRYDATGRTDDKFIDAEEMGWDAYFGTLFERLDGKMLNEHKAKYQGTSTPKSIGKC
jgi:DnaJ family protein C protein 9